MLMLQINAIRASMKTLLLIGALATLGSGVMTIGLGMDTPWAPWERQSKAMFPPVLFTVACFAATVAFCASTIVYHNSLKMVTQNPVKWWRISGILFLVSYGIYSFGSGTTEAAFMLNILHCIVGIPALILLPRTFETIQFNEPKES